MRVQAVLTVAELKEAAMAVQIGVERKEAPVKPGAKRGWGPSARVRGLIGGVGGVGQIAGKNGGNGSEWTVGELVRLGGYVAENDFTGWGGRDTMRGKIAGERF